MKRSNSSGQTPPKQTGLASVIQFRSAGVGTMPDIPMEAVLSFIKETRGDLTWTVNTITETLKMSRAEAAKVLPILELQGYIKQTVGKNEWMTTINGETVSGSKAPHFSSQRVSKALSGLEDRIQAVNDNRRSLFRITEAVAFGDFLHGKSLAQAADVGICLVPRHTPAGDERDFLRKMRARNSAIQLAPYRPWMSRRLHHNLLSNGDGCHGAPRTSSLKITRPRRDGSFHKDHA